MAYVRLSGMFDDMVNSLPKSDAAVVDAINSKLPPGVKLPGGSTAGGSSAAKPDHVRIKDALLSVGASTAEASVFWDKYVTTGKIGPLGSDEQLLTKVKILVAEMRGVAASSIVAVEKKSAWIPGVPNVAVAGAGALLLVVGAVKLLK